jgi:hypothetical protein
LPSTPALRREEIKLQVAIITPLLHVNGYASLETKAAAERARLLIEQVQTLGEPPEDPLLLFAALYGLLVSSYVASNGDVMRELATQFLAFAKQEGTAAPILIAHRIMGIALMCAGEIERSEARLIWIRGWHFTITPSMVRWRHGLAWMLGYRSCATGHGLCGSSAILGRRSGGLLNVGRGNNKSL